MESASGDKTNKRKDCMTMIKRGSWKQEEDLLLKNYIETHGEGKWTTVSKRSGLMRGAKSCRMRWKNHLRPNIKHGQISQDEEDLIIRMHKLLGNRWSLIAGRLPGRTDNEIKNYWNTHLSKQKLGQHHRSQSMKPTCLKSKKRNPRSTKINNNPNPTSTGSTISLGERVAVKATVDTNVIYRQDIEQDKVRQDDIKPKYPPEIHDDITINEINESYVTQTSLMPAHSVECKSMNYWEDIDTFSWWPVWENIEFYEPFLPSLEEYSSVQSTGFTS